MQSMTLFFPPVGAGGDDGAQLLGMCACGGMMQLLPNAAYVPPCSEIKCSSAVGGGCIAHMPQMPITPTIRDIAVRPTATPLSRLATQTVSVLLHAARLRH